MKKFIVLALIVEAIGVTLGYFLGLSDFWSVVLGLAPAMLILFPAMKKFGASLTLIQWGITVGFCIVFSWLIHFAFGR